MHRAIFNIEWKRRMSSLRSIRESKKRYLKIRHYFRGSNNLLAAIERYFPFSGFHIDFRPSRKVIFQTVCIFVSTGKRKMIQGKDCGAEDAVFLFVAIFKDPSLGCSDKPVFTSINAHYFDIGDLGFFRTWGLNEYNQLVLSAQEMIGVLRMKTNMFDHL